MSATQVLLATDRAHEAGEPGHEVLDDALAERGISSRWAVWDDPFVDWAEAKIVAVRSTWDYDTRLPDFLGWAGAIGPSLLHGVDVFRWNTDKSYLLELAQLSSVPVVPSELADNLVNLRAAVGRALPAVVKPRVGAGGRGIVVVYDSEAWLPVDQGPWVVQPLVRSVMTDGEESVFVINGHPVSQLRKVAGAQDFRVHEEYGGTSYNTPLTHDSALLAADAVAATTEILGCEIVYARVDMMRLEGRLVVSEVEVTEPGLYLDLMPENATLFADAIAARL
jgi:glutathione synthase/RimK-type ligase-like ATP-grasp enzyme